MKKLTAKELEKNRMNLNQLQSLLRQSETFSIREVAFCYLEPNGSISILKKPRIKKQHWKILISKELSYYVPVTLIRDGKVLWDEIRDLKFDESWFKMQLQSHSISNYKEVFIAEWLEGDAIFVTNLSQLEH